MKRNIIAVFTFLILISCSKSDNQQKKAELHRAENVTSLQEDTETQLDVLSLKNLVLNSDSLYILIGETSPNKGSLYIKERLTNKEDLKRFAAFIPEDTTTTLIVYPTDTMKGNIPPPPPPSHWGRPIGVVEIYNGASVTKSYDFTIDSSDTFIYSNSGRRRKAFTKEGDTYFRRMNREYKSLQPSL